MRPAALFAIAVVPLLHFAAFVRACRRRVIHPAARRKTNSIRNQWLRRTTT
jgi:hypothetical protein